MADENGDSTSGSGRRVYTTAEVAEMCDLSIETIRRAIRSGDLPAAKFGSPPSYRISAPDLNDWWRSRGGNRLVETDDSGGSGTDDS